MHKNNILIVDDDKANLLVLNDILCHDYSLLMARDGINAFKILYGNKPDLILLDIRMPGIDGFEILKKLKATETTREIPVIFISGLIRKSDEKKGMALGAAGYIRKPFNPAMVIDLVEKAFAVSAENTRQTAGKD